MSSLSAWTDVSPRARADFVKPASPYDVLVALDRVPREDRGPSWYLEKSAAESRLERRRHCVQTLKEATDRFPDEFELWLELGKCARSHDSLVLAAQSLERALMLRREDTNARGLLARTRIGLGSVEQGLEDLTRLFEETHDPIFAAEALTTSKRFRRAPPTSVGDWEKSPDSAIERAQALAAVGAGDLFVSLIDGLEVPESPESADKLGQACERVGELGRSLRFYAAAGKQGASKNARIGRISELLGSPENLRIPESPLLFLAKTALETPPNADPQNQLVIMNSQLGRGGAELETVSLALEFHRRRDFDRVTVLIQSAHVREQDNAYTGVLEQNGVRVEVFGEDRGAWTPDEDLPRCLRNHAGVLASLSRGDREDLVRQARFYEHERPLVAHVFQDQIMAVIAAVLAGVPRVLYSRVTLAPQHWSPVEAGRRRRTEQERPAAEVLLRSGRVLLTNNCVRGRITDEKWFGLQPGVVAHLPNASDLDRLDHPSGEVSLPSNVPIVGGAFRFADVKRPLLWIDVAAEVAKTHPNAHFVILGDGSLINRARAHAHDLGLSQKLSLPGHVPNVRQWMQRMTVLVMTSEREGVPNVCVEAQLAGVPIVAPKVGGIGEAFEAGMTGLFASSDDALSIADAVRKVLEDLPMQELTRGLGPARARRKFGPKIAADAALKLYLPEGPDALSRATRLVGDARWSDAKSVLEHFVHEEPENEVAMGLLIDTLIQLREVTRALDLSRGWLGARSASWWKREAQLCRQEEAFGETAGALRAALEVEPDNSETWEDFARFLRTHGGEGEARELIETSKSLSELTQARVLFGLGQFDEAAALMEKVDDSPLSEGVRGAIFVQQGKVGTGVRLLAQALGREAKEFTSPYVRHRNAAVILGDAHPGPPEAGIALELLRRSGAPFEPERSRVMICANQLGNGGAERQTLILAEAMVRAGYPLTFVVDILAGTRGHYRDFFESLECQRVWLRDPNKNVAQLEVRPEWAQLLQALPEAERRITLDFGAAVRDARPEVVLVMLDSTWAILGAALAGAPKIFVRRGLEMRPGNPLTEPSYWRLFTQVSRELFNAGRLTILNNSHVGCTFDDIWLGRPGAAKFVPNIVSPEVLDDAARTEAKPEGEPVVGGFFRLASHKRPMLWVETIHEVAKQRPNVRFLHLGAGVFRQRVEARIRELGLEDRVELAGGLRRPGFRLPEIDVLLHTSHMEGTTNAVLEAQAIGIPAVVCAAGDLEKIIVHGETGFVDHNPTPESLASYVIRILDDREWRSRASRLSRARIRETYSAENSLAAYLRHFGMTSAEF